MLPDIDKIIRLMKKYKQTFALMHCISLYPSDETDLQLSFIKSMKKRYPDIPIGWSTHEDPNSLLPSSLAKACGAEIFERHIGINSKKYKLNKYSMEPNTFEKYIDNLHHVKKVLSYNDDDKKHIVSNERLTLNTLQRGLYAKSDLKIGDQISDKNTYLAFPLQKNQIPANLIKKKK